MKNVVKDMVSVMQPVEQEDMQVINPEQLNELGAYEIAPGMTSEQIQAEFFNSDALREQPEPVYRLDSSGRRYYYNFDENGEPRFFVSVTTMIKQNMPTSPQLIEWIAKMGVEESKRYAAERASYGTFIHAQIASLIINRTYDLDQLKDELRKYIEKEKLPTDFINYAEDFKKDILAFAQFMRDVDLIPLAIELVLTHPEDGYAGALDLAAEITIEEKGFFGEVYKTGANAGKPKETKQRVRIRAIIDFKSGRKGFFPEHEVQLHAYKEMWNIHFPDMPIDRVFNWSPKDWRGSIPTYNFKDQTGSQEALRLPLIVGQAKLQNDIKDNTVVFCSGIINLDADDMLEGNITEMSLAEVVKVKQKRIEEAPENAINPEEIQALNKPIIPTADQVINIIENKKIIRLLDAEDYLPAGVEIVVRAQDIDNHRWYSQAEMVVKCSDGYVGIWGPYQLFSESMGFEDLNIICTAYRIEGKKAKIYDVMLEAEETEKTSPTNTQKDKETKNSHKSGRNGDEKAKTGTNTPSKEKKALKEKTERNKKIETLLNDDDL